MASSEEEVEEKENAKKKPLGTVATVWLIFYNIAMTAGDYKSDPLPVAASAVHIMSPLGLMIPAFMALAQKYVRWLVLAIAMCRFYMGKGTHKGLYKSIQKTLKFFQTFALLELIHCALGLVRTSVLVTGVQVSSRIFMVWFITNSIKQIQNEESVLLFLVVWTVTEITRYSYYTFNLLNHLPYFIKWARYNLFIVLYPVGVAGELLTIYAALPYVRKTGMYSLRLPNKYNVSFDYYYFLLAVMCSYIPLFPQLYFHMLRQRRRVLHGEVIVEKDD